MNEARAWRRYRASGDKDALAFLMETHDHLIWSIVEKTYGMLPVGQKKSIYEYGKVGLWKAINAFDKARGNRFATVAWFYVRNEIKLGARETDFLPSHWRNEQWRVRAAVLTLEKEGVAEPSAEELAERAGMSAARVETVRRLPTGGALPFSSLSLGKDGLSSEAAVEHLLRRFADRSTLASPSPEAPDLPDAVQEAFRALPPRSRVMVYRHLCQEETFAAIGQSYGVTRQAAQNVIYRSLLKVKETLGVAA